MDILTYDFDVYNRHVTLYFENGQHLKVFLNQDSGKIYMRPKIGSAFGVYHKGIYLGHSDKGQQIMIHNHSTPGRAVITTWEDFVQNQSSFLDDKICSNAPIERLKIALGNVLQREPYALLNNSCQTFVNETCTNERKNDDTAKVLVGLAATGLIIAGLSALFGD